MSAKDPTIKDLVYKIQKQINNPIKKKKKPTHFKKWAGDLNRYFPKKTPRWPIDTRNNQLNVSDH